MELIFILSMGDASTPAAQPTCKHLSHYEHPYSTLVLKLVMHSSEASYPCWVSVGLQSMLLVKSYQRGHRCQC